MTTNLGRRFEHIDLTSEELARLLHPAFPGRAVDAVEPLTGGAINTNLKVRVSGLDEAFVLRLYTRDAAACRNEVGIINLVHGRVPVPEIVYADSEAANFERPYMIYRWVDGDMLQDVLAGEHLSEDAQSTGEIMRRVGAVLADIGAYRFSGAGFFGPGLVVKEPFGGAAETWRGYIEMCLDGPAGERLGPELTGELRAFVSRNEHYLEQTEGEYSLVHSDFNGSNILVREGSQGWEVAAVLDWEWAFSSSQLTDIGNMLRDRGSRPPEFEHGFIEGFTENGGHLPSDWKRIAKLVDLTSMCEFLNSHPSPARLEYAKGIVIATIGEY